MYVFEKNDSFFQSLHPLTLFAYLGVLVLGAITVNHPVILLGLMVIVLLALPAAKSFRNWLGSLKIYFCMITMYLFINLLLNDLGTTIIWHGPRVPILGRLIISWEALAYSLVVSLRLLIVYSAFILLNRVVNPDQALTVLARVFPKSALLVALTAKTIPYMIQQLLRAAEIQQCRGVQYYVGHPIDKVRNRLPLIKVLLVSSLEDSLNLGESIQARAYGCGPRSSYSPLSFHWRDGIVLVCVTLAGGVLTWLLFKGWAGMEFYPVLGPLFSSPVQMLFTAVTVFLLVLPVIVAWGWERWHYLRFRI